jgi:hypothetical protein
MARVRLLGIWLVCVVCAVLAVPWMLVSVIVNSPRAWTFAKGFDRVGNVMSGGGDDEYLSSRAQRVRKEGRRWACVLCRLLDNFDPGHCDKY